MYLKRIDAAGSRDLSSRLNLLELDEMPRGYENSFVEITEEEYNSLMDADNKRKRIAKLKQLLINTDYISCKIAEGAATREEYAEIIEQRRRWREEINQLEEVSQ